MKQMREEEELKRRRRRRQHCSSISLPLLLSFIVFIAMLNIALLTGGQYMSMAGRGAGEPPPAPTSSGSSHQAASTWRGYHNVLPVPPLSPDKKH